jgi:hypothetical protein
MTKTDLIRAWFDGLWHNGDESTIERILAPEAVVHGLGPDLVGPDQFRNFYRGFRAAFPSVHANMVHVFESGDHVVVQTDIEVMAANGQGPFHFHGSATVRVQNDQFVEGWNNFDFLSLLTGMGAVPSDVMTKALTSAAAVREPEVRGVAPATGETSHVAAEG